jgi:hypothetical protein
MRLSGCRGGDTMLDGGWLTRGLGGGVCVFVFPRGWWPDPEANHGCKVGGDEGCKRRW